MFHFRRNLRAYRTAEPGIVPLPVNLVNRIGLSKAFFYSYIFSTSYKEGHYIPHCLDDEGKICFKCYWIRIPINEFNKKFTFCSKTSIIRSLNWLQKKDYINVAHLNTESMDRTNWYSINNDQLLYILDNFDARNERRIRQE